MLDHSKHASKQQPHARDDEERRAPRDARDRTAHASAGASAASAHNASASGAGAPDEPVADNAAQTSSARRRVPAVALLPSLATLGNLLCGVLALVCGLLTLREAGGLANAGGSPLVLGWFPTYVAVGAHLIVLALIFDALDGRLARLTRQTSAFGAQLDSLADMVTFGVAPVLLVLAELLAVAAGVVEWRFTLLAALVFASAAAVRLARYNVEHVDVGTQRRFHGLPVPGAAAGMAGLLMMFEAARQAGAATLGLEWALVVRLGFAPAALGLALLMVSRINYTHVFQEYVRRERPVWHPVAAVALLGAGLFFFPQATIALAAWAYIVSGLVIELRRRRRRRRGAGEGRGAADDGAGRAASAK